MKVISSETKKVAGVWSAETTLYDIPRVNGNTRNSVKIFTTKSRDAVTSSFQFGDYSNSEMFDKFTYIMFQDRRGVVQSIQTKRVTKSMVSKQHSLAVHKFLEMMGWNINQ